MTADAGRFPVVPIGNVRLAVPPKIGLSASAINGAPLTPLPLATVTWLAVPNIVTALIAPADEMVIIPFALRLARFKTCPVNVIVGSPDTPLPLEMDRPLLETAIERGVMAVADVFT